MHPTPSKFAAAVLMIMEEYEEFHKKAYGEGAPYEAFDQIDGLVSMAHDLGRFMTNWTWHDNEDNPKVEKLSNAENGYQEARKLLLKFLTDD